MSAQPVDVLDWMAMARRVLNGGTDMPTAGEHYAAFQAADEARAAVAELVEADREYDAARLSGNAVRLGNAAQRRRAALARVQGGAQ